MIGLYFVDFVIISNNFGSTVSWAEFIILLEFSWCLIKIIITFEII